MLNQKGQESAPFELLVAIVVMGFVLLAGFRVIQILTLEECKGKLDSNLEELKTAIENVALDSGQRSISFTLPGCFPQNQSELKITNITERQVCSEICNGARLECMVLQFYSPEHSNWKCLRISSATDFPTNTQTCNDFPSEEYTPNRWRYTPIDEGQYILIKKTSDLTEQPRICAYKREV